MATFAWALGMAAEVFLIFFGSCAGVAGALSIGGPLEAVFDMLASSLSGDKEATFRSQFQEDKSKLRRRRRRFFIAAIVFLGLGLLCKVASEVVSSLSTRA